MTKTYRTIENDSFDAVAYRVYGRENLCHEIMAANPEHMDVLLFPAGVTLVIPEIEVKPVVSDSLPPWQGV